MVSIDNILLQQTFKEYIAILNKNIWNFRCNDAKVNKWLENFNNTSIADKETQKTYALHLLSQFTYFGTREVREMLKFMYKHLYMYPIKREIRKFANDTLDCNIINNKYLDELKNTRFLGLGNPSESSYHLLYYFRQENKLLNSLFIHSHDIFEYESTENEPNIIRSKVKDSNIKYYIFIDDFCGGGTQAKRYSTNIISNLKTLDSNAKVFYFTLLATSKGIENVKKLNCFDKIECVFELNNSFKIYSDNSRYFKPRNDMEEELRKKESFNIMETWGKQLDKTNPLGFNDCQLGLGFSHNTPNNTLPIFWSDKDWNPIFKRYDKQYSLEENKGE